MAPRVRWKFHLEENSAATCFQASLVRGHCRTSSPYSARMASQVCLTMTEMVLCATLKPNIRLLYFSPVAKKRSVMASLHPGLMDCLYHVSYFSILGPILCKTSLNMAGSILTKFLNEHPRPQAPHQSIIVTIVQPPREPRLHAIPPGPWSTPSLSVNQYLVHHNLILLI